jgi:hypothetical protein
MYSQRKHNQLQIVRSSYQSISPIIFNVQIEKTKKFFGINNNNNNNNNNNKIVIILLLFLNKSI